MQRGEEVWGVWLRVALGGSCGALPAVGGEGGNECGVVVDGERVVLSPLGFWLGLGTGERRDTGV